MNSLRDNLSTKEHLHARQEKVEQTKAKIAAFHAQLDKTHINQLVVEELIKEIPRPPVGTTDTPFSLTQSNVQESMMVAHLACDFLECPKLRHKAANVINILGNGAMISCGFLNPLQASASLLSIAKSTINLFQDPPENGMKQLVEFLGKYFAEIFSILQQHTQMLSKILTELSIAEQRQLGALRGILSTHQSVYDACLLARIQYALVSAGTPFLALENLQTSCNTIADTQARLAYKSVLQKTVDAVHHYICKTNTSTAEWYDDAMATVLMAMEYATSETMLPLECFGHIPPTFFLKTISEKPLPNPVLLEYLIYASIFFTSTFFPPTAETFEFKSIARADVQRLQQLLDCASRVQAFLQETDPKTRLDSLCKAVQAKQSEWRARLVEESRNKQEEIQTGNAIAADQHRNLRLHKAYDAFIKQVVPIECFYGTENETWWNGEEYYRCTHHCDIARLYMYCGKEEDVYKMNGRYRWGGGRKFICNKSCWGSTGRYKDQYEKQQQAQFIQQRTHASEQKGQEYVLPLEEQEQADGGGRLPILTIPAIVLYNMLPKLAKNAMTHHLGWVEWRYALSEAKDLFLYVFWVYTKKLPNNSALLLTLRLSQIDLKFYKAAEGLWKWRYGGSYPDNAHTSPVLMPYEGGADLRCGFLNSYVHVPECTQHDEFQAWNELEEYSSVFSTHKQLKTALEKCEQEERRQIYKHEAMATKKEFDECKLACVSLAAFLGLTNLGKEYQGHVMDPSFALLGTRQLHAFLSSYREKDISLHPGLANAIQSLQTIVHILSEYSSEERKTQSDAQNAYIHVLIDTLRKLHAPDKVDEILDETRKTFVQKHKNLLPLIERYQLTGRK